MKTTTDYTVYFFSIVCENHNRLRNYTFPQLSVKTTAEYEQYTQAGIVKLFDGKKSHGYEPKHRIIKKRGPISK